MPITVCSVTSCLAKDIMFHFPRNINMQNIWLSYLAPHSPELLQLSPEQLIKKRICIRHFESRYLDGFKRKFCGFPTLFTEEEISNGVPNRQSITVFSGDHTYCKARRDVEATVTETVKQPKYSDKQLPGTSKGHIYLTTENSQASLNIKDVNRGNLYSAANIESVTLGEISGPCSTPITSEPSTSDCDKSTQLAVVRSRLVTNIKSLTPKCRKLYYKCRDIIKKRRLFPSSKDMKQNIAHAENLTQTKTFHKLIEKLNFFQKKFIQLQLRFAGKGSKARRYDSDEKLMCIVLYKQSPKGYSLLQKIFSLPTKRTLNRVLCNIKLDEGINQNLFAVLKEKVKDWSKAKKFCSIVFDEVQLSTNLNFVPSIDEIEGFIHSETGLPKFADHALVIMLRGICASWRQPVAYYFCQGTTSAANLKIILTDMVDVVLKSGLKPLAFICDQGVTSQRALKDLEEDTKRTCIQNNTKFDGSISIRGAKMSIIYDPPHLMKGIRNNMLNKDLIFEGKLTQWQDIVDVYNYDCELGNIKMLPKLTDEHVIPIKIKKMKVKNCTQVFSERVAATMKYTATFSQRYDGTPVSKTTNNTAEAIAFFDRLFDSCNGSRSGRAPGKLRGPVKAGSAHETFWIEAVKKFKSMEFKTKHPTKATMKNVPTLKNWITTVESLLRISQVLRSEGVNFFYTRNLNQDPLENFFGKIRSYNYRYTNPDTYTFRNSFKSLLMTNMLTLHTANFNCENDIGETIFNIKILLSEDTSDEQSIQNEDSFISSCSSEVNSYLTTTAAKEKICINAKAYTAGYIIRKLCSIKCLKCKRTFLHNATGSEELAVHDLIKHRERKFLKCKNLMYPNTKFIVAFSKLVDVTNSILETSCHKKHIIERINKNFILQNNLDWLGCSIHNNEIKRKFILLGAKLQVFHWCRTINRILNGAHSTLIKINSLSYIQKIAYEKYLKQKKIKSK